MTQDPILRDMLARRDERDRLFPPCDSLGEVRTRLDDVLDRLRYLVELPAPRRNPNHTTLVRQCLLDIAARCYCGLRDLGLETEADAIAKDIPF